MLGGRAVNTMVHPRLFISTATAIVRAEESASALTLMREHGVPVVVVHGELDMIVPLDSAVDTARLSAGILVTLPSGYHSWVLSSPWTFVQILRHMVARGAFGAELRAALDSRDSIPEDAGRCYLRPNALVLNMIGPARVIGGAEPRNQRLYHDYRIWDALSVDGATDYDST